MDHEARKYINSQQHLNKRHTKWVAYFQQYTFSFRHKSGALNKVAYGLSRRVSPLLEMKTSVVGYDDFHTFYAIDPYFSKIFQALQRGDRATHPSYMLTDGWLKLCVPSCSLREQLLDEQHKLGHFG